jgi:AraC-like DNA-binding protein
MRTLLETVRRYAEANSDGHGVASTAVPGLSAILATAPSELSHAVNRPLVALVLQGSKRVTMGAETFDFGAGESLLITADVPTASQVTRADASAPYVSLVLELQTAVVEELTTQMIGPVHEAGARVRVDLTDVEVADAALRLMGLLDRPSALAMLQAQLVRELHYWLLAGRHGAAIRRLGIAGSHTRRISRAIAIIRVDYAKPLRVEQLAEAAAMSASAFHEHFRAVTSLSPRQFQKQLRLIEARRLMLSESASLSAAAFAVGYESVPQFTREYGRMFGRPPGKDIKAARSRLAAAAA